MLNKPMEGDEGSLYFLHIIEANLIGLAGRNSAVYAKVALTERETACTSAIRNTKNPTWNFRRSLRLDLPIFLIIQVKCNRIIQKDLCLGEVKVSVDDLKRLCEGRNHGDVVLDLLDPKTSLKIGSITVFLEASNSDQSNANLTTRKILSSTKMELHRNRSSSHQAHKAGFDALESICSKLSMLRPLIQNMDEISKIHPYFEGAWKVVSALYKIYQKKVRVDEKLAELVHAMNNTLSFVEDTTSLKEKLQQFSDIIEEILSLIEECCNFIIRYLNSTAIEKSWGILSEDEEVNNFKYRFSGLNNRLYGSLLLHNARKSENILRTVENIRDDVLGVKAVLKDQHGELPSLSKVFKLVSPAPPTDLFTGREKELLRMAESFDLATGSVTLERQRRFVICGLGGMGKTQVALKFLEDNRTRFSIQYIIDASTEESIKNSLESIGHDVGIVDGDANATLQWFCRQKEGWVLLYDNADDPTLKLTSFIPKCSHGNIIITTRNSDLQRIAPKSFIEVSNMEENSAIELLFQSAGIVRDEENLSSARKIVKEFGYLPLAIVQAGSYIVTRRLSLEEYSNIYEENRASLMRVALGQEVEYDKPVYATWEISFAGLSPSARLFLETGSFLHREGIPELLFRLAIEWRNLGDSGNLAALPSSNLLAHLINQQGGWDKYRFANITHELLSFSLIQEKFKGMFSIHPLVHTWARERMPGTEQKTVQTDVQYLLYYASQGIEGPQRLALSRMILPHLEHCERPTNTKILSAFSDAYEACGRWKEAEALQSLAVKSNRDMYGDEYPDTLTSMHNLALVYAQQSRDDDATQLQFKVVEARKRLLGIDHPETVTSMDNLAVMYKNKGCIKDAIALYGEVMEIRRRTRGAQDEETLTSMSNLALLHNDLGHFEDAVALQLEVLEANKALHGNDYPGTLTSLNILASLYQSQGLLDEAVKLQVEVIEARTRVLGPENPSTLISRNNLAGMYRDQGRLKDAIDLQKDILDCRKRLYGDEDPDTLHTTQNLISLYQAQGLLDDAMEQQVTVLAARRKILGSQHRDTLTSMYCLATIHQDQGRIHDAMKLQVEVLEARMSLLGDDHPETLTSMHDLAQIYHTEGRFEDAVRLQSKVVEARQRLFGSENETVLISISNLASMYQDQGRLDDAVELLLQEVELSKRLVGLSHPDTLASMGTLLSIYESQDRVKEAMGLLIEIQKALQSDRGMDVEIDTEPDMS